MTDFDAVLKEHGAMLARIAQSYEADRGRAEDLTQEILVAVWRALPSWRGDASLKTFIARIAHYRAVSHVSRESNRPRSVELDEALEAAEPSPEHAAVAADTRARLLDAVRKLPHGHRQVVTLLLEGFTNDEVAETLGLTPNNVAVRLNRAKSELRRLLGETR